MRLGGGAGGGSGGPTRGARGRRRARVAGLSAAVLATLFAAPREAAAKNAISSCSVSSAGLTFGAYDLLGRAQVTGTGTLTVQCTGTGGVTVNVALSTGSGSCTTRTLKSSSNSLDYNIYTTSGLTTVWCDPTTRVPLSFSFPSNNQPQLVSQNVTMYGAVAAGQSVPSGTYSDTLLATAYWNGGNSPSSNVAIQESAPTACSVSASGLAFGAYTGAASQAQTSVTATCSLSTPYTIALSGGSNLNGTQRRMTDSAGHYIPYDLYSDSARTTAWGDGTSLGATVSGTGAGSAASYTVYGATAVQSATPPGNYSDSVVVTVSY